ncbi:MAG: vacuolar protein sorting-associated family 51 protein, partial [Thaumarchaeota archaeon]|nr:vacuolar protein sorting-associated family 51 protein [Nitrososphaerota archaeon]
SKRSNRAALREYYKLKNQPASAPAGAPPLLEVTDALGDTAPSPHPGSDVAASELDAPGFDASAYVARMLETQGLGELLRTYARVLGETRALDAEKKALVYDNYSKLISATETIRKMRANMDPLNPVAATLDPAISQVYAQAGRIRGEARRNAALPSLPGQEGRSQGGGDGGDERARVTREDVARRKRTQKIVREVLAAPERVRDLVRQGRYEDAKREWALPRRLLVGWSEKGVGGDDDVQACLQEGEAALKGEDTTRSAS